MSGSTIRRALLLLVSALGVFAIYSPVALASGAPIITNTSVGDLRLNTAMLHTDVNPNGLSTTYKVEYGKTKLYGKSTLVTGLKSASTSEHFDIELPGLEAMSTYHYRVSATNSAGTTTTADTEFETLLDWKVEGTRATEMAKPVSFEDNYKSKAGEGGYVEFRGTIGITNVRFYCGQSARVSGLLGVEYSTFEFKNGCYTQLNGVKNENCKPSEGIELNLDGNLALPAKTTILTSIECAIGSKVPLFGGGYGILAPVGEASEVATTLEGTTYFTATKPFETTLSIDGIKSPGAWKLTGLNAGKKLGIS